MNKKIGEKIRQLRALKGLNQENVAEEIGMSSGNFGKIERGEIEINSSKLIELAKVLKVSPGEFFEEKSKALAKEVKPDYGFATKEELASVVVMMQNMIKEEFEKLKEEITVKKVIGKKIYNQKK